MIWFVYIPKISKTHTLICQQKKIFRHFSLMKHFMTFSDGRGHLSETETFIHKFFFGLLGRKDVINVCFYFVRKEQVFILQGPGFPPVRIWYGQFVYWKVCPCPVRTKPKTTKCPYIPQKNCFPYQLSVFFFSKTYENFNKP
jgi:hypothetical protein